MRIFVSYSRADVEKVRPIAESLKTSGYEVFVDMGRVPGGESWASEVQHGIDNSDWILALISPAFNKSRWARREILYADTTGKPILPIVIESTEQFPITLASYQYINISEDIPNGIKEIVEFLKSVQLIRKTEQFPPSEDKISEKATENILDSGPVDRVFIAYSRKQRPLAKELNDLLTSNGKAVFYDAKIKAGASWRQTIQKALDDATHVVVVWTPDAAASDEVEREVSYALAERKVIVPILSKAVAKLPYHLHGLHYIILDDNLATIEGDLLKAIAQYAQDDDIWQ